MANERRDINDNLLPNQTLIKQRLDNVTSWQPNKECTLHEKWKGRYDWCLSVVTALKNAYNGKVFGETLTYSDFITAGGTLCAEFDQPAALSGNSWVLDDIAVDECDGGCHGFVNATWTLSGIGIGPKEDDSQLSVADSNVWDLHWESQQFDVYAFCANKPIANKTTSYRSHIDAVFNIPPQYNNIKDQYAYQDALGSIRKLNENELSVYQKKASDANPLYHYPVITNVYTWNALPYSKLSAAYASKYFDVPDQIVTLNDPPFPSTFIDAYEWVYQGSDYEVQPADPGTLTKEQLKQHRKDPFMHVRVTMKFVGAIEADYNFYGPIDDHTGEIGHRWLLGQM